MVEDLGLLVHLRDGTLRHEARDGERHGSQNFLNSRPQSGLRPSIEWYGWPPKYRDRSFPPQQYYGNHERQTTRSLPSSIRTPEPIRAHIPRRMVTFCHNNFDDILPEIGAGGSLFHEDLLHHLTGQDFVRDQSNDFGQGMGGPGEKDLPSSGA